MIAIVLDRQLFGCDGANVLELGRRPSLAALCKRRGWNHFSSDARVPAGGFDAIACADVAPSDLARRLKRDGVAITSVRPDEATLAVDVLERDAYFAAGEQARHGLRGDVPSLFLATRVV